MENQITNIIDDLDELYDFHFTKEEKKSFLEYLHKSTLNESSNIKYTATDSLDTFNNQLILIDDEVLEYLMYKTENPDKNIGIVKSKDSYYFYLFNKNLEIINGIIFKPLE